MYKIRNSIFETNSSSSHSLVYSQENPNRLDYHLDTTNGTVAIHFHEYGCYGPENDFGSGNKSILATANDKLDYVMSYLCCQLNWSLDEDGDWYGLSLEQATEKLFGGIINTIPEVTELLSRIRALCPDVKEFTFTLDVKEFYNDETCEIRPYSEYPFGYIDHQSQGLLDGEDLINIIFNKGCIIIIDGDNQPYFTAFNQDLKPGINSGLVSKYSNETYSLYNITEKDFED